MGVVFHPFFFGHLSSPLDVKRVDPDFKLDVAQDQLWYKAMQLPLLMNYFERSCYLKDLNYELFSEKWSPLDRRLPPVGQREDGEESNKQAAYLGRYSLPEKTSGLFSKYKESRELRTRAQNSCGTNILPEYLNWSISASGITSARQTYETLESYGDTVLKLAATMLAYEWKKNDRKAGEGDIENMKVAFITNFHLYRVGFNLRLHRYIKTLKDPEPKEWKVPLKNAHLDFNDRFFKNKCIGKAVSDSVEAMIGAIFLTASNPIVEKLRGESGLYRATKWLSDISCVPLKTAGLLETFSGVKSSTMGLDYDLYKFGFSQFDRISDVYKRYFRVLREYEPAEVVTSNQGRIDMLFEDPGIGDLGQKFGDLTHLKGDEFRARAYERLESLQNDLLHYKFKNPKILLSALTHPSAKSFYQLDSDYEKLEALGDAILDYMININMMRFTMFERYLPQP
mmetsp:Transcript_12898/g.19989  ORF Transcript_12898/g.19989 Transcript_12898/m.19989 type:complete len:454 (-) Transcript_12898:711-2072(-)|eukprot:CAMPEP_0170503492 /NCGR_PEP_ID=MMETSP0208-20121228/44947_1 /TAXON_ID=197538 /ORGANISM="Strombidium inclinatum, Strain S3" /LENGTH=453 /DNA_ID=CAMNT_0010783185 /DNA_START=720 /DNA_END=2081 /DNA_ORIENTATION=+